MSHLLCITIHYKLNAGQDLDFASQFGYYALEILTFQKFINAEVGAWPYLKAENPDLFSSSKLIFEKATTERACLIREDQELYQVRPARKKLD